MSSQVTFSTGGAKRARKAVTGTKKRTRKTKTSLIPRSMAGIGRAFPEKLATTHKYVTSIFVSVPVFGTLSRTTFKANGMFDPDDRLGGHQPLYFDTMTSIYNHYVVNKSTIKVTFLPQPCNDTSQLSFVAYLGVDDDTTLTTNYELQGEILPTKQQVAFEGNKSAALACKWSASKVFGSKVLDNPRLQGTANTDPTELSHFGISLLNFDSSFTRGVQLYIEVVYDAVWFELKTPVAS